jgi:hypothetical protein
MLERDESRTGEGNSAVAKIYRTNSGMQTKLEISAASTQLPRRGKLGAVSPARTLYALSGKEGRE